MMPVRPHHASLHQRRAFTLIELLAVLVIIAILAAICIPVVGKVRENAKAAIAINNIRQVGMGVIASANENQGLIPYKLGEVGDPQWSTLLDENYFSARGKRTGLFRDPFVVIGPGVNVGNGTQHFSMNALFMQQSSPLFARPLVATRPATTILLI